ncbi:winged helix-turn-helix domain-containing protein [Magnetospirillum sp. UT-4]|uniref:winged helix-turn-helix domain-containing protein n=1 Tax=Magnetospirillum sp. UT-4 TaxID=2681467 RepID=UPI001384F847|nr:winged helix-turn-helix domain-containing protein [Magnetospirillum sp. UT-4]CAA7624387.1 hypothetical protein MTBUT4_60039 [Magnetospirillum sp. UT-4]
MNALLDFDKIALGDAKPAEARAILRAALEQGSTEAIQRAYTALRSWVWKTLDGRRRDDELHDWFDILKATQARLEHTGRVEAERLRVLQELIDESIAVAQVRSAEAVIRRPHVMDILLQLRNNGSEGRMGRDRIGARLNLRQANLSRILGMMVAAGLIEREPYGKYAAFRLTRTGMAEVNKAHPEREPALADKPRIRSGATRALSYRINLATNLGTPAAAEMAQQRDVAQRVTRFLQRPAEIHNTTDPGRLLVAAGGRSDASAEWVVPASPPPGVGEFHTALDRACSMNSLAYPVNAAATVKKGVAAPPSRRLDHE